MSQLQQIKRVEAARKRQDREATKRQKDLQKRLKESEKMSELERMRLEVAAHEAEIEVLLSVHKEVSGKMDWGRLAHALPPHRPVPINRHHGSAILKEAWQCLAVPHRDSCEPVETAWLRDHAEHQAALADYEKEVAHFCRIKSLAHRVLRGDVAAFGEALAEFSAVDEIAHLGASLSVRIHDARTAECSLVVSGTNAVPSQVKSLTSTGKLTVKAMPKGRFHEIYQDYVCGSVLRVAREVFALLPLQVLIITALIEADSPPPGQSPTMAVLSVAITRDILERLDFQTLDPSDTMEHFIRRGDAKASRKSGHFVPVEPLAVEDVSEVVSGPGRADFHSLLSQMDELRKKLSPTPRS